MSHQSSELGTERWLVYTFIHRPMRKILHNTINLLHYLTHKVALKNNQFIKKLHKTYPEKFPDGDLPENIRQKKSDHLHFEYLKRSRHFCELLPISPKISIIVPIYKVKPHILQETILSVVSQTYQNWELCLVDDASGDPQITELLMVAQKLYPHKIKVKTNTNNVHISETSNVALGLATGEYVGLLDHDDILLPHALAEVVRCINKNDKPEIIYSDERVVGEDGSYMHGPFYKPGWSPMLHLSCNYTTHFSVYSKSLLDKIGGFRKGYEGSQDHDLMLRAVEASKKPVAHIPFILYFWRAMSGSTALNADEKPYAAINGMKAVKEALLRRGRNATVEWEPFSFHYRIRYEIKEVSPPQKLIGAASPKSFSTPLVSIIIPTRDHLHLVRQCIESIIRNTSYEAYEVIVVNNDSVHPETLSYLASLKAYNGEEMKDGYAVSGPFPEKFRVIDVPGAFNFGRLNNEAVKVARGEYLLLLNNDTIVRAPQWIEEMLSIAQWPEIGAVGCKLLYEDGTIQHAGVVLQDRRIAAHKLKGLPSGTNAYINIANTIHEVEVVTAACLLVAKEKYLEVGGLDDLFLANGFGDVDFCLKLRKKGYNNIYTPYAVLTHLESKTRGRTIEHFEKQVMLERWGRELLSDQYVNLSFCGSESYVGPDEFDSVDFNRAIIERYWQDYLKEHSIRELGFQPSQDTLKNSLTLL